MTRAQVFQWAELQSRRTRDDARARVAVSLCAWIFVATWCVALFGEVLW